MGVDQNFTGTPSPLVTEAPSVPIDDPQPSNEQQQSSSSSSSSKPVQQIYTCENKPDQQQQHQLLPIMPPDNDYESIYHPTDQDGHPYIGLVNQAMTCYLNSLIQSLFMTPEFRNILYEWQFNGTMEEAARSIPFQLQKLFALLQTTSKASLETKDLTQSFGWEGSDAYEQHDVQELSRVMLEALEHRFRKSEQHRTFIQNLYKGTMEDVVKCLGCQRESVREDIFNDLALAIREFGATESYKSVEEALTAFIKLELLTGSNKYKCENCKSYQDAEKGFRFTGFPYMLVMQLKRFTVDYTSGFRVKLNDTMTFPDYLDLNGYIYNPETAKSTPSPSAASKPKMSYASVATKKAAAATLAKPETIMEENDFPSLSSSDNNNKTTRDADGWINKPPTCDEVQEMLKKGPYVYELFAIMIHQGSATGGHYFAYIKNLEQSRWLCFNDTQVKAVDLDEVKRSFGGPGWASNTNAYLMIYRQIDFEKNQKFTRNVDLPKHVSNWLKQWEDEENRQACEQQRIESLVKVRVALNDERNLADTQPYGAIENSFSRDSTGKEVAKWFCNKFNEMGIFASIDSCLLIPVNTSFNYNDDEPFDFKDSISTLVRNSFSDVNFIMELKKEDFNLPKIDRDITPYVRTVDFLTVDITYNIVRLCKRLCAYDSETMESIRNRICSLIPKCDMDGFPCRMVLDYVTGDETRLRLIDNFNMTLGQLLSTKFQITRFYIDCGQNDMLKLDRSIEDFTKTQMCKIIEKQKYGIRMKICLPNASDYRQAGLKPPPNTIGIPSTAEETSAPSPPVSPISKKFCQLGPLNEENIAAAAAAAAASSASSAIATSSSTVSNRISQPNCLYTTAATTTIASSSSSTSMIINSKKNPQICSPLTLERFVNSNIHPNSADSPPPPGYDDDLDEIINQKDPRVSPIEGASAVNDPDSLNVFSSSDNEMDIDCPGSANISPNVSDNEENRPPPYDETILSKFNRPTTFEDDAFPDTWEQFDKGENENMKGNLDATSSAFIDNNDENGKKSSSTTTGTSGVIYNDAYNDAEYTVDVVETYYSDNLLCNCMSVVVDSRQYTTKFIEWIARYLKLCSDNITLSKHYSETDHKGYEINVMPDETVKASFSSVNRISVSLRVPTKPSEKLIRVVEFDLNNDAAPDTWATLFHAPASNSTTIEEFKEKCQKIMDNAYAERLDLNRIRLREITNAGAPILHDSKTFNQRSQSWDQLVALQRLKPEEMNNKFNNNKTTSNGGGGGEELQPIIVRRFCPSTLEIMAPYEILIPDKDAKSPITLKKAIAQRANLMPERIGFSELLPKGGFQRWPFTKTALELMDITFTDNVLFPIDFAGKSVYFIDKNEPKKHLSEDERRSMRIRERINASNNTIRRTERPLRIQMSSISESEP